MDDDDNGTQPGGAGTPAYSPMIHLQAGTEPMGNAITGTESGRGGDIDDYVNDADGDMTVDFGFVEPGELGIGNLVFEDTQRQRLCRQQRRREWRDRGTLPRRPDSRAWTCRCSRR